MKRVSINFLCFVILLPLSAKSKVNSKKMPVWVESPYSAYSSDLYFAATGSDKNKNQAELKAVEAIAAVFGRDVESSSEAESHITHYENSDGSGTELVSILNQQILVEIDQKDLIGIEIKESFYDENSKFWYALALMDKEKTADLYINLIERNNKSIQTLISAAKNQPVSMKKLAYYYRSMRLAQLNESYLPRFYLIHPEKCNQIKNVVMSAENLKIEFDKIASQLPISVSVSNDFNGVAQSSVEEVLKSFGFVINEKLPKYKLVMEITPSYRVVENPTIYYCEFIIASKITNQSESVLVPWNLSGRAGGKNEELAKQKAYAVISEKIKTEYSNTFETYLYGETE